MGGTMLLGEASPRKEVNLLMSISMLEVEGARARCSSSYRRTVRAAVVVGRRNKRDSAYLLELLKMHVHIRYYTLQAEYTFQAEYTYITGWMTRKILRPCNPPLYKP